MNPHLVPLYQFAAPAAAAQNHFAHPFSLQPHPATQHLAAMLPSASGMRADKLEVSAGDVVGRIEMPSWLLHLNIKKER